MRIAFALLACMTGLAAADDDTPEPTAVSAKLAGTKLQLRATFAIEAEGPGIVMSAGGGIEIPPDAVVTGASIVTGGKRRSLRLERSDVADRQFDGLTAKPGRDGDRASAIRISASRSHVSIDMLVPGARMDATVELSLELPTCFYKDVRYARVPRSWWKRVPAFHAKLPTDEVVDGCHAFDGDPQRWIGLPAKHLVGKPASQRVGAIAARLPLDTVHVARVELDLARELSDVPADLHTAIVIDHSRSLSRDELEAQRVLVAAYLRAAPRSAVQVIGYARKTQPLLPSWMIASHAAPKLDRAIRALAPRNGSNLDAALGEAATWLAQVGGTKRIIVFTDERFAERLIKVSEDGAMQPSDVLAKLIPAGTLVHVVRPHSGVGSLERNDDALLAPLAAGTEGIFVDAALAEAGGVDATMLVRPITIDHLTVGATGWQPFEALTEPGLSVTLPEGKSFVWWLQGTAASGPLTIAGRVWNRKLVRTVRPDPSRARDVARELSVASLLDEQLQAQIDRAALAVNSVWSLFAIWGGSGGYEDLGGFGTIGMGRFSSSSHDHGIGSIGTGRGWVGLDLKRQLQPAVDRCGAGAASVDVTVETTLEEIVEVGVNMRPHDPVIADCVTEAVWDTTLHIPDPPPHTTTRVAFGNKP